MLKLAVIAALTATAEALLLGSAAVIVGAVAGGGVLFCCREPDELPPPHPDIASTTDNAMQAATKGMATGLRPKRMIQFLLGP